MIQTGNASGGISTANWTLMNGLGQREAVFNIIFDKPFFSTPAVTVHLNRFDLIKGPNQRLDVSTRNINRVSFELVFTTWSDTQVYSAGASWIAHDELGAETPDEFILYDNLFSKVVEKFAVQFVYENEIYALIDGKNRSRVAAFLYPQAIKDELPNPPWILALEGNSTPNSMLVFFKCTKSYVIVGQGKTTPELTRQGNPIPHISKHTVQPTQNNPFQQLYWGYDLTDSVVLGKDGDGGDNNLYRITSLLIPGFMRELELPISGLAIKAFGYLENIKGPARYFRCVSLVDKKVDSVS